MRKKGIVCILLGCQFLTMMSIVLALDSSSITINKINNYFNITGNNPTTLPMVYCCATATGTAIWQPYNTENSSNAFYPNTGNNFWYVYNSPYPPNQGTDWGNTGSCPIGYVQVGMYTGGSTWNVLCVDVTCQWLPLEVAQKTNCGATLWPP